jgi:Leucine-rich repeat (LRR) protein
MLLIELGIDRTIFIGNVVLRGTADSDDVFSIFSSHASILFPATLTLLDLDDMFVMARRKNPEKKIDLPYSGFTRQINSKPARIFLGLGTACWAFSGVLLIFHGLNSYVVQKKICAQYFGDAVGCLGPNLWYRDGLFQTSCAVENITHFDCGGKNVVDVPENPSVYNKMESLTTINFSNCPNLKTVPLSFGNLTNLNYLDLSNTNPTKLPLDLLRMESLVEINLDNTPVSKRLDLSNLGINRIGLSRTAISAFSSSLTFLNLSSNNFRADPTLRTTVPYSDFNEDYIKELLSLTSLKQIDLSHNKVRSVKSNNLLRELFFRNNDSDSSVLLLEGNYIESIYMSTIVEQQVESCGRLVEAIGNLESPRISYVGYTTSWHAQDGGLPFSLNAFGRNGNRLTTLNIEQTTLTKVPDLSPVAFSLEKLYLGKNQFNDLEASLPLMPNLKHLRLDQCCVGSKSFYMSPFPQDPGFFGKIPSVNRLGLGKNKITHLRREISHLRMLKNLDLDSNNIVDEGFPSSFVNLSLTALHVDNNKLTKYPVSLQQMQNSMVRLSLNGMPTLVATLPSWFWSASKMSSIDLANCSLTSVPLGLQNLTELHHVDLGGNNLSTIPTWLNRQTFSNFENLVVHDIYNKKFDVDNPLLPKSCFFLRKGYVDVFRNKVNKRRCTAVLCLVSPIQIEKLCSKGEFLSDCAEPCAYQYFRETVGKYCKGASANGGYMY